MMFKETMLPTKQIGQSLRAPWQSGSYKKNANHSTKHSEQQDEAYI